jgi:large subunit ribosomal protein L6
MSRIGKKPLKVPAGVQVKCDGNLVQIKGPKGQVAREMHSAVAIAVAGDTIQVSLKNLASAKATSRQALEQKKFHGLSRTLIQNMLDGVTTGYTKTLTLVGVGYRAAQKGKGITMTVGFSHPVEYDPPAGVTITVPSQTSIVITGADKETVGMVAAKLRGYKPPEPYHGKGVRYAEEVIQTKVGKAAGKK